MRFFWCIILGYASVVSSIQRRNTPVNPPPNLFSNITSFTNLTWSPCLSIYQCALLDVPLDYASLNGSRASVPLMKYPATTTSYKGMVLTNPGGPVGEAPAVLCTDTGGVLYNKSIEDMAYITENLKSQSWVSGELMAVARMNCAGWPIKGTERYPGPFGGDTKTLMLFMSNTRDPATPIYNGQKWFHRFKDAQLLTIDATGHTSVVANNTCAFDKINTYFQTGELPGNDNFCALEAGPWDVTIPQGIENVDGWREIQDDLGALRTLPPCQRYY